MDLSWCIICDRHCADNDLYCSEVCRFQDTDGQKPMLENTTSMFDKAPSLVSPPASPIMSPLLYSFQPVYH
ncbi:hypothetical protein BDF20DRAFT_791067, partial [Mycotypha africana]|uniref:uncharacterized protein n=1 Tax=Mycotypha africana TaxID=64632 RepID=UPI0023016D7B